MQRPPTLGTELAAARKREGKSLREMAARILKDDGTSITPQYLNDLELNHRTPSPTVLDQLAKVYGFDSDYLYHLAGTLPKDIQSRGASQHEVVEAYRAFRKKLKG
jgi:transcriptional regulator with XRE-family HTH domain